MNDDIKLKKVVLGPDWIDLGYGEPKIVGQALFRQLNRVGSSFKMPTLHDIPTWEYQPAAGKPDLISVLEKKYGARVVVTNGAKQALAAALFAFKRSGRALVHFGTPYYPANPSISKIVGIAASSSGLSSDCKLITTPNNPDGSYISPAKIIESQVQMPTIHDAVYYTDIYIPDGETIQPLGDIQIFSMSKMYGISGLRIGYAICHNEAYYKDIVEYVETTTAGVSTASQDIARNVELFFINNPSQYQAFVKEARIGLIDARKELKNLDPDVLELMPCESNGMFGWFKVGPALDNTAAKVHMMPGELFGQPGMMRMNIAHPPELIREAIGRLNKFKKPKP